MEMRRVKFVAAGCEGSTLCASGLHTSEKWMLDHRATSRLRASSVVVKDFEFRVILWSFATWDFLNFGRGQSSVTCVGTII